MPVWIKKKQKMSLALAWVTGQATMKERFSLYLSFHDFLIDRIFSKNHARGSSDTCGGLLSYRPVH